MCPGINISNLDTVYVENWLGKFIILHPFKHARQQCIERFHRNTSNNNSILTTQRCNIEFTVSM